ncbi:MAG: hypothetical protein GKR94_32445 [Gammaproteobacteria bacterium]|nr:hypothetical protein [Gammaproteobacteria bacterium]
MEADENWVTLDNGKRVIMPTKDEDAAITAAALDDPDNLPLTDEEFASAKVVRRPGRPPKANPKIRWDIRVDPEVDAYFRSLGKGWQTKVNQILKDAARS